MGWSFKWLSSGDNSFNYDYNVSFTLEEVKRGTDFYNYRKGGAGYEDREGTSVFYKDDSGSIFHTYSAYARGIDMLNTAYHYIDIAPRGRDEESAGLHPGMGATSR